MDELAVDKCEVEDDIESSDEGESEEGNHEKLLEELEALGSTRKKRIRTEPSSSVSDYNISTGPGKDQKIDFRELVASISKSKKFKSIKEKLANVDIDQGTVEAPLPKPQVERIKRTIAYQETSKDISKWTPTIRRNRQVKHVSFPLDHYHPSGPSLAKNCAQFKASTPLEKEIAAILNENKKNVEKRDKELTEAEEQALQAMDLEEAKDRLMELKKMRALQSYFEQKCKRRKKIKSKRYHRIKKKAAKKKLTELSMEELINEDPELAKEELEKEEKDRAQERVSLRHRNTSKWSRFLAAKGRNDPEARKALTEQLRMSRELTEKKRIDLNSDNDRENENENKKEEDIDLSTMINSNDHNPWLTSSSAKRDVVFSSTESKSKQANESQIDSCSESNDEASQTSKLEDSDVPADVCKQIDVERDEFAVDDEEEGASAVSEDDRSEKIDDNKTLSKSKNDSKKFHISNEVTINPNQFISGTDGIENSLDLAYNGSDDEQIANKISVAQAFADDDVVEEFEKEKLAAKEASKPKEIDLKLPGWGSWGGSGIKKRKRKIKSSPAPARKDDKLKHVIINESVDSRAIQHQVTKLPHGIKNYKQWHNTVRKPIGKEWNMQSSMEKAIQPRVNTLMGTIINPIQPSRAMKKKGDNSSKSSLKIIS